MSNLPSAQDNAGQEGNMAEGQGGAIWECWLSAPQVAELAGIKYPTLDRWFRPERGGFMECTVPARGRGRHRRFAFLDTLRVLVVARLRAAGVPVATIRRAITELAERYNVSDPLTLGRLVVAGNRLYWAIDDATLLDVLAQQTALAGVVILPVGEMAAETRERMEAVYCQEAAQEAAR